MNRKMEKRRELTHIDLFSGIGGFSLGFEWAGFKTIAFAELDEYASAVLRKHWPGVTNYGDVSAVPAMPCTVLTGGPPCQPFSIAGRKQGTADNRNQWPTMYAAIRRIRPDWIVVENVVNAADMVFASWIDDLEECGYASKTFDIPSCAVGLSSVERHVWIIATRNSDGLERIAKSRVRRKPNNSQRAEILLQDANLISRSVSANAELMRSYKRFPNYVDRIRCVGNAVPPQVTQAIAEAIKAVILSEP